jgi:adhesin transport system outer membrane protein
VTVTQNLFKGFGDRAIRGGEQQRGAGGDARRHEARSTSKASPPISTAARAAAINVAILNERNIQNQLASRTGACSAPASRSTCCRRSRGCRSRARAVAFEAACGRPRRATSEVFDRSPDIGGLEDARPPREPLPPTLEDAVSLGRTNNPNGRISDFTARANDDRRDVEKAEFYPSLDLVGSAEYEDNTSGLEGSREIYSLFLRSRWEFFSGLKSRARVEAASKTYEASKSTRLFTLRKVDEEVRISWENLQTQQQRVELLENAVAIAEEVLRARRQLREAGKETALNVLDAEGEVFNAQINRIEAEYDARIANFRLIFATQPTKTLLPEG